MKDKTLFLLVFICTILAACTTPKYARNSTKGLHYVRVKNYRNEYSVSANQQRPHDEVLNQIAAQRLVTDNYSASISEIQLVNHPISKTSLKWNKPEYTSRTFPSKQEGVAHLSAKKNHNTEKKKADVWLLLAASLTALASGGTFVLARKKMRRVSEWAKNNKTKTRWAIAALHIVTGVAAFTAGHALYAAGFLFSPLSLGALAVATSVAVLFYPTKNASKKVLGSAYLHRKLFDLAVIFSGGFLLLVAGNQTAVTIQTDASPAFVVKMTNTISTGIENQFHLLSRGDNSNKEGLSTGVKILLTVVAVAIFFFLGLLVGALACGLSCDGQDALAAVVLIGGWGLLILFLVMALKGIYSKKKNKES